MAVGFLQCERKPQFAGGDQRQDLVFLRVVAREFHRARAQHAGGEQGGCRQRAAAFLQQQTHAGETEVEAAVLLGNGDACPAKLGHA
jgi:hypothetical protein